MIYRTNKPPSPAGRRYTNCWEYMFVFSKGDPKTWHPQEEPSLAPDWPNQNNRRRPNGEIERRRYPDDKPKVYFTGEMKRMENIWYLPRSNMSDGGRDRHGHPATFPLELPRRHILSWTDPGDLVLDPFVGSGTTALAAEELGRAWVGIDNNPITSP